MRPSVASKNWGAALGYALALMPGVHSGLHWIVVHPRGEPPRVVAFGTYATSARDVSAKVARALEPVAKARFGQRLDPTPSTYRVTRVNLGSCILPSPAVSTEDWSAWLRVLRPHKDLYRSAAVIGPVARALAEYHGPHHQDAHTIERMLQRLMRGDTGGPTLMEDAMALANSRGLRDADDAVRAAQLGPTLPPSKKRKSPLKR